MSRATKLETDYLVVGCGAMGMAFADVLLEEGNANVIIVDRRASPGGHWNDAYPYVRLHQPSAFYGVNSVPLGNGTIDQTGWNAGLYELATGAEIRAYFDHVMHRRFIPSGRVQYFPMCDYLGNKRFRSRLTGQEFQVEVRERTVDATYMHVSVPATRGPLYAVDEGVRCVPLNDLPRVYRPPAGYVIVGAGKTGMDACLWLLAKGVDASKITWIVPRDSWMHDRSNFQPGRQFAARTLRGLLAQTRIVAESESVEQMFDSLGAAGVLLRLDESVRPTMYRCAQVSLAELEQLRRIKNVVRMGRVERIERDRIVLQQGVYPTSPSHLHVDCTADGLAQRPVVPVFDGDDITLQSVRTGQQVFSSAFIAHVECAYQGDAHKNRLCAVIPHPNTDIDWLRTTFAMSLNQAAWTQDAALIAWLNKSRLDGIGEYHFPPPEDERQQQMYGALQEAFPRALMKMQKFLADLEDRSAAGAGPAAATARPEPQRPVPGRKAFAFKRPISEEAAEPA